MVDSDGELQPSGSFTINAADGAYACTVPLEARFPGNDKTGRTYTVTVTATDNAGNTASVTVTVTVPHGQGG